MSTKKNNTKRQLWLDAGPLLHNLYCVLVLQVNAEATGTGFQRWLRKNPGGTHGKLAETRYDTLSGRPA